jgi:hypothetical protein
MEMAQAAEVLGSVTLAERLEDLERIAKLDNVVLRNLLITQRYHDLSHELARVIGQGNANWSTFATWASRTAGTSIRKEELPKEFIHFLNAEAKLEEKLTKFRKTLGPFGRMFPDLDPFDLARAILEEVSVQIAIGNLRVYYELTPLFATFSSEFSEPHQRTEQALDSFVARLKEGPAKDGGQGDLKLAFRAYFQAASSQSPGEQAQLILYGNVLIGLHEQTRLQENIAGALDAPFSQTVYERFGAFGPKFLHSTFRWIIRNGVKLLARELLDDWQRIATRFMMKLQSPHGEEISLGSDLPPEMFDPLLQDLTLKELIAFLTNYDPDLTTTKGSGAVNWTLLSDRMRFIGELFRVSQSASDWFDQPFQELQRQDIESGRVPEGPL